VDRKVVKAGWSATCQSAFFLGTLPGVPTAAIARMVRLTRKTVYKAIRGQEQAA